MPSKKIQLSITLDEDQIAWMDKEIADNRFATRSHAIVYAISRLMKEKSELENLSTLRNEIAHLLAYTDEVKKAIESIKAKETPIVKVK